MRSIAGAIVVLAGAVLFAVGAASSQHDAAIIEANVLLLFGVGVILADIFSHKPSDPAE